MQPLTIEYCQDGLRIFRVSLVAAMQYTVLQTRRHIHLVMEKPRTTSQDARPQQISPNLNSECLGPGRLRKLIAAGVRVSFWAVNFATQMDKQIITIMIIMITIIIVLIVYHISSNSINSISYK